MWKLKLFQKLAYPMQARAGSPWFLYSQRQPKGRLFDGGGYSECGIDLVKGRPPREAAFSAQRPSSLEIQRDDFIFPLIAGQLQRGFAFRA